jgi:hypothetical protein
MKKKACLSVYIALLFLIFLVVVFPYKEGFDNTIIITRSNSTTHTRPNNFFDYYWPFSDTFLISTIKDDERNIQGDPNIDDRTDNTHGYNDVDYRGFNTSGTGNDGKRYTTKI